MKLFPSIVTNRLYGKYKKCYIDVEMLPYGYYLNVSYQDANGVHKINDTELYHDIETVKQKAIEYAKRLRRENDEQIIKSRARVKKYAEVFTPKRIVKQMVDALIEQGNVLLPESTVLEPTCGEGAFLIEILERKLNLVKTKGMSIVAINSLYGVDIQEDNVIICRNNLFKLWRQSRADITAEDEQRVKDILQRNIAHGNFLTKLNADGTPIWFLENNDV